MPFDSNGRYSLPPGYLATTGQTILASQHNPPLEDISAGLSTTLLRTGVAPMVANLQMGGYKVTNLAVGVASTDAVNVGQAQGLAVAAIIGATTKAVPVDADTLPLVDSEAGNTLKRLSWANLKALFQPANAVLTALAAVGVSVAGDIIYATGAGTWGRLAKGTARQALLMNAGATAPAWTTLPFTQSFESSQQTITSGGSLTLAHGLGSKPKLYQAFLVNVNSDGGYSPGDEVAINPHGMNNDPSSRGVAMVPDATNINCRFGTSSGPNSWVMINKTNGSGENINAAANWKLIVRAWA